jgi:hypothetical protein
MAYATEQERKLLHALESLLAMTEPDSLRDQETDPALREDFARARDHAVDVAEQARTVLDMGAKP